MTFISDTSNSKLLITFSSVGHKGKFGHEFLEFEFRSNGRMRYANNSQYKSETLIRKEGNIILKLAHNSCLLWEIIPF